MRAWHVVVMWGILSILLGVLLCLAIERSRRRDLHLRIKTLRHIRTNLVDDPQAKAEINKHVKCLISNEKDRRAPM